MSKRKIEDRSDRTDQNVRGGRIVRAHMIRPLLILLLAATSAFACSVPVFRYALEHWEADLKRAEWSS